ncbi:hypothetical protein KP509_07G097800 [Ceratopteris richardii]|uniref:Reverse transcriptase zinc-binding domain-containing protein n=1 Tax=Ceratopteris richardii TaxID=49495 RepID=A0A8T2UP63_CERRI|nr:hypothetical protein KP509_07G097800 [Ceratopteris richardii]
MVALSGKVWSLDPPANKIEAQTGIWAYGKKPLARLQWDPGEYVWEDEHSNAGGGKHSLFQYTVQMGRRLQRNQVGHTPSAAINWEANGIPGEFIHDYWRIAHKGIAVGAWLFDNRHCARCGHELETIQHCMWECKYAQEVWKRILRILSHANIELLVAWGSAAWASLASEAILDESSRDSKALSTHRGVSYNEEVAVWWELLSGITMWTIWKNRCTKVFEGKETPPVEAIKAIWLDMVYTLRGQLEEIKGDSTTAILYYSGWNFTEYGGMAPSTSCPP